jgi:thiamine biosynthesis lipoprotein
MTSTFGVGLLVCCTALARVPLAAVAQAPPSSSSVRVAASGKVSVERETYLMGTLLRAQVGASDREVGLAAIESAFATVARLEDLLSTWRDDTELSRLNHAPVGTSEAVSPALVALLAEVRRWRDDTDGAFDPGLGSLIDAWDMRGKGRIPSRAELESALSASGLSHFQLDPARGTLRRTRDGSWIDSGAFGKGAALRSARDVLEALGIRSALLDFGGQVLAIGDPDDPAWTSAVAHPSRRQEPVALIRLSDASASTSGQSERAVEVHGCRLGHILDPRTGFPVPAWGSVTVVAADPLEADALSTGLFVLGPDAALRWARGRADVGVLVLVESDDEVAAGWNDALASRGIELAPGVRRLPEAMEPGGRDGPSDPERRTPVPPPRPVPGKCDLSAEQTTQGSPFKRPIQPELEDRG